MALFPRVIPFLTAACLMSACSAPAPDPVAGEVGSSALATTAGVPEAAPPATVSLLEYAAAPGVASGRCALDAVDGAAAPTTAVASGARVGMSGWISDAANGVPVDALLVLSGASRSYSGALPVGNDRPDVATALGNESARPSGFNIVASLDGVEPGEYTLSVVHGGVSPQTCALGKALSVSPGG